MFYFLSKMTQQKNPDISMLIIPEGLVVAHPQTKPSGQVLHSSADVKLVVSP